MRNLRECIVLKNSLERQIENSRNTREDLIDCLDDIEVQIAYLQELEEFEKGVGLDVV